MKPVYKLFIFILSYAFSVLLVFEELYQDRTQHSSLMYSTFETERIKLCEDGVFNLSCFKNGHIIKQEFRPVFSADVNVLPQHPLFPHYPDTTTFIRDFEQVCCEGNVATRISGWISPNISGYHIFRLTSSKNALFRLMLWPSIHHELSNISINFRGIRPVTPFSVTSKMIFLKKNKSYYLEILTVQIAKNCSFSLQWKRPLCQSFANIDRRHFLLLRNKNIGINFLNKQIRKVYRKFKHLHLESLQLPLPKCVVNLNHVIRRPFQKYEGVQQRYLRELWTEVFPRDATWDVTEICDETKPDEYCAGNRVLQAAEAMRIVERIMVYALEELDGDCELKSLIRVQRHKEDNYLGRSRIFLEMILHRPNKNIDLAFSEFLFEQNNHELCYDRRYAWSTKSMINIIFTVSNQGSWLKYILTLIKDISYATFDKRINVIVADFNSTDINVHKWLKSSKLRHYHYIRLSEPFVKFKGIQAGLDSVTDDNSICLLMDLHVQIPVNFFDLIRKHTIKGQVAFNPIVMRLAAGRYADNPAGYWEIMGFGIISMYKKDWRKITRLDTLQSKESWGGEDWELVDFISMAGIEISRFRVDGFFHYYHTHQNLWNGSSLVDENFK